MRKRSLIAVLAACILAVLLVSGCGEAAKKAEEQRPAVFTDDLGREVSLEEAPSRIVSISPACTEILFGLGLGDKVVGVTEYCDYPEEALEKEKIGTFTTPNLEAIVALEPDLVLATGGVQAEMLDRMEELGLTVYAVNPTTFDETLATVLEVGEITGAVDKAEEIVTDMNQRAVEVARRVNEKEKEGKTRPRAFFEIYYENNVWTAGKGSIISDLIRQAGGENIGDVQSGDYYEFSVEELLSQNPQVYLVGSGSMSDPGDIASRPGWDRMEAVRDGRVYVIEENLLYRTGPRLIDGLEAIHAALYPEE